MLLRMEGFTVVYPIPAVGRLRGLTAVHNCRWRKKSQKPSIGNGFVKSPEARRANTEE